MHIARGRWTSARVGVCSALTLWPAAAFGQAAQTQTPPAALAQSPPPPAASPDETRKKAGAVSGLTVRTPPQQAVRASIDRRSYSVATDLQGSGGSVADALRNLPGVEVDINGNLSLRGGRPVIMIDGQPTSLFSGQGGAQALQSMSADRVDRVEVITNPTAAFSPEGQAGIINLVTKKSAPAGASGGARANIGGAGRSNGSGNLAYVKGKLTVTAEAGWRNDRQSVDAVTAGTVEDPVTGEADPRTSRQVVHGPLDSRNGRVGFDYQLDPRTRLSAAVLFNDFTSDRGRDQSLLSTTPNGAPLTAYSQAGQIDTMQTVASGQATLRHTFPGQDHTLVMFFSHTEVRYRNENASTNVTTTPEPPTSVFQAIFARTTNEINQFKADYTRPMPGSAQLKAGYDLRVNNTIFNNYGLVGPEQANAILDPVYSNLFRYNQMVNAVYVTYEHPIGKLTVLGGLRLEDEQLRLTEITQSVDVSRNDLRLFPSLHLDYKDSPDTQWVLSYSSRIQRPAPFDLDPFRNLADPYNIRVGNPKLKPQETQSFEGGWQYQKGATSYLATLFYRQNERGVTDLITTLGAGALLTERENLANSKTGGLELVAAAHLTKTLTYNVSTDVYWYQIQAPIQDGLMVSRQDVTVSGRGNLNWQATKKDLLQLNAQINAAQLTPNGHVDPLYIVFLGYRHKFTDDLALVATTVDPFNWIRQYAYYNGSGLDGRSVARASIRTAYIGFTWTFGGRGRPRRDTGIDFNSGDAAIAAP